MLFSFNGKAVRENTINGDDTIRDVALKLTKGQGGVYLYGKQKKDSSAVTVWQKYKRPLTAYEMTAELRNLGIQRKVGDQEFDYEDIGDYIPPCDYEYVALGQTLSRGVRVRPPKQTYSLGEYLNVSSVAQPEMRLVDYPELTEVHVVAVRYLMQVYLPHPPGIVPQDMALQAAVSTWVWNIVQETLLLPKAPQQVDLANLFSKIHATELVPYVTFGKLVRFWSKEDVPSLAPSEGVTFHMKKRGTTVAFYGDGKVKCVRTDPFETNPIVHYVNQVLAWGTALECDWTIIGKSTAVTNLFSDAFFPLWTSATQERATVSAPFDAVAYTPSPAWQHAFSSTLEYVRCSPPAILDLTDGAVYIHHLPAESMSYATRYAEGMLTERKEADACWVSEAADSVQEVMPVDPSEAYIAKFVKAGFEMGLRYRGGALCMDENSGYGFLPCPDPARGINQGLLEDWVPTLGYAAVKQFLVSAARVEVGVEPRETVVDYKGECVGVRTRNGAFVRCKPEPLPEKEKEKSLRRTTEHALRFPKTGHVNGTYRELVRHHGFNLLKAQTMAVVDARTDDFPQWREGKLLLTRNDLETFEAQLKNDMARFHHLRSYIMRRTQEVNGHILDLLNGEQVTVLNCEQITVS